jgi:hypothetical protein
VLDGLPIVPDGAGADLLVSDADRRAALGQLEDAVADGRVTVAEHGSLQARIQQADRLGVRREVVRQALPGDPGPVHIQDRVDNLAEIVTGFGDSQPNTLRAPSRQ